MFYSHEVLTSRKHGVATIWLVATLGSRSSLRKVNRKDIQAVNVKKACETIITPTAPMALRLQSNLLYGVSRVHSQQCTYVLADAQNAQQSIHTLFKDIQAAQLNPEAGRARPDQLVLPDDPAFLPDFAVTGPDLDTALFDFASSAVPSYTSSVLSSSTALTQPSPTSPNGFAGALDISSSTVGNLVDIGALSLQADEESRAIRLRPSDLLQREEDEGLLPEPDFVIDAEGNLTDFPAEQQAPRSASQLHDLPSTPQTHHPGEIAVSTRSLPRHEAITGIQFPQTMEDVQFSAADDYALPSDAQPFSTAGHPQQEVLRSSSVFEESEDSSSEVQAPQRRRRQRRPLRADPVLELRNADLALWSTEYVSNMQKTRDAKFAARSARQARQNAETWVITRGLGNVGLGFGRDRSITNAMLAELFSGEALWEGVTGLKRPREVAEESEGSESAEGERRRVRRREDNGEQIGRGEPMELDEVFRLAGEEDVELPREAPSALDPRLSDTMPWNITASLRHSSVPRSTGPAPFAAHAGPSSTGRPSSTSALPGNLGHSRSRAGSRIISASPLVGRGLGLPLDPSFAALAAEQEAEAIPLVAGDDQPAFPTSDIGAFGGFETFGEGEFEPYGSGAAVDMQTAAASQWMRGALDAENGNFLEFVKTGIRGQIQDEELYLREGEEVPTEDVQVKFDALLPPERNTRLVAAAGLLHVLSLATRGLLNVKQEEAFGEIGIGIVGEL